MRILMSVLALAALAGTADAQNMGGKGRNSPQNAEQKKVEEQKKKATDDAYKSALGRIPDPKDKYDPWHNTR